MKKIFKIQLSVALSLSLCLLINLTAFSNQCNSIRDKIFRMHVIANSDSQEDQQLKLKIRDAVLQKGKEIFDGSITADEAIEKITPYIDELKYAALSVIKNEGFDYDVEIVVKKEFFNTRVYNNSITLPAGYYNAIRVVIGEGRGQNWWCVMFPPMCIPSASVQCEIDNVLSKSEKGIVSNGEKYKFRFKIVEFYEELVKKYK